MFNLGVNEPDFHVIINLNQPKIILVAPNVDPDHVMWLGLPDSLETLQEKYDVDQVIYANELDDLLKSASKVYTLPITKTTISGVSYANDQERNALNVAFQEARIIKSEWEIEIMRKANKISSDAHIKVNNK